MPPFQQVVPKDFEKTNDQNKIRTNLGIQQVVLVSTIGFVI